MVGPYERGWNDALDEVSKRAAMLPFNKDTQDSMAIWVKQVKRMPLNMSAEEQERWLYAEGNVEQAKLRGIQADKESEDE